ncbi:MAG: undecaprenyl/decaprenyl-phosphate alpha-N-acetylglucosaminyl 1-phosphate transferase [Candidatus Omnitrophica bacterium]|nr:undecaprenyl/decaprenyl-phosphate alpha-N-acetylglucosaminyl 1-phosphate transferase [Candidatus Omnitrophota bacterium]MBU1928956.1 undecaprenyl/decaprenyl-phosphate alpha-N-acetylglucosaminyl 1-phosphate transferase [Candidatus Omnitrophota bacterium]MBU2035376.1 undecaprenyl/decaprenyl-phosphate alpha-N-acetylglucosaminyl 1-phosphate transferase [Candidatus Omnitrophota bacterium]MBU2258814.1 undecaprenyl/decaprenyl-phosphate alpha-N-acetylglucosaminyl 1-phosphate transferase [Candidatus O
MTSHYYFFITVASFLSGILFLLSLRTISSRFNILMPKGMSLVGGIGIGLSFFISISMGLYLFKTLDKEITGILISIFIMFISGIIDDQYELSIKSKLIAQGIAVFILVLFNVRTQIAYIGTPLNILITFVWVIGITNAVNHLDIIDGLAALTALIIDIAFLIIGFAKGDVNTIIMTLALGGALSSLLIFNLPPAKIYMGNSGSHFLGFVLAVIAISISYAHLDKPIALLSPLLILGLPIFDTIFLIIRRIRRSLSPFNKSDDHFAFGFRKLGFSNKKTLIFMLTLTCFFTFSGILLSKVNNLTGALIIGVVVLAGILMAKKMNRVLSDNV